MDEIVVSDTTPSHTELATVANPESKEIKTISRWQKFKWPIFDTIAATYWVYAFTKIFVADVDLLLLNIVAPTYTYLLSYRVLIFLGLITFGLLFFRNFVIQVVLYIVFFPIIFPCKIIFYLYKNRGWQTGFILINTIAATIRDFRIKFITASISIICFFLIIFSSIKLLLCVCAGVLLLINIFIYIRKFFFIFNPSKSFAFYKSFFPKARTFLAESYNLDPSLKGVSRDVMTTNQQQALIGTLQISVLHNRVCLFVARRFRDYQKSRVHFAIYVLGLVGILAFTILSFSAINLAIYKISPSDFHSSSNLSWFDFFYYSFGLIFQLDTGISVLSISTRLVQMSEIVFAFLLLVILLSAFVAVQNDKYDQEMDNVVSDLEKEGAEVEAIVTSDYGVSSLDEAITLLTKAKAGLLGIILSITKDIT